MLKPLAGIEPLVKTCKRLVRHLPNGRTDFLIFLMPHYAAGLIVRVVEKQPQAAAD
jgi:hypothetical protein